MSNVPATVWNPKSGEGEFASSGNPDLLTESSSILLTEAGSDITLEDVTFTDVASTVWTENPSS